MSLARDAVGTGPSIDTRIPPAYTRTTSAFGCVSLASVHHREERPHGSPARTSRRLEQQTHTLARQLRWWRGTALVLLMLGLISLPWQGAKTQAQEDIGRAGPDAGATGGGAGEYVSAGHACGHEPHHHGGEPAPPQWLEQHQYQEWARQPHRRLQRTAQYGPEHAHRLAYGGDRAGAQFSSFGGLVLGRLNTISGVFAAVTGGINNTASEPGASVSGGTVNTSSGVVASVSGGANRTAVGDFDWVAGSLFQDF